MYFEFFVLSQDTHLRDFFVIAVVDQSLQLSLMCLPKGKKNRVNVLGSANVPLTFNLFLTIATELKNPVKLNFGFKGENPW